MTSIASLIQRHLLLAIVGLVALMAAAGTTAAVALNAGGGSNSSCTDPAEPADAADEDADDCNEQKAAAGTLDDGEELLSQASISLDQAIAAARAHTSGNVGEV